MTTQITTTLNKLLEKTSDWDKDERYMATSDLCAELNKDVKLDAAFERRICTAVLKQLDDTSNDVQSIAVKCLGILLRKVQEAQVGEICDKLCSLILEGKAELRDIYSIGLKTLIADVPSAMGPSVARRLTPRLFSGVQQDSTPEVKLECLDNLTDLLRRFGREVESEHDRIINCVTTQLASDKPVVRKRATACLGTVATVVSDPLLNKLAAHLLAQIKASKQQADIVRTYIQTIGTISRTVGHRLGRHLDAIVPLFLQFCGEVDDEELQTETANELRENCFQGFESFVLRCPREVTPHLDAILDVSLRFMKYDPNYNYGDSDDEDAMDDDNDGDADMYDNEDDFGDGSDDDDTSWKVRRSAVRVLRAIISSRPERLEDLCGSCCDALVSRFKEREENVRIDVLMCFTRLLDTAAAADGRSGRTGGAAAQARQSAASTGQVAGESAKAAAAAAQAGRGARAVDTLREKLPAIVKAAQHQVRAGHASRNLKTTAAVWQMLRALCEALNGGLAEGGTMAPLIAAALTCLKDKHQGLKLEALLFLHLALESHHPVALRSHIPQLVPAVVACVGEEGYKVIAEALRVVGALVCCMCPTTAGDTSTAAMDWQPYAKPLYDAVLPRLSAHDIDQEIKECAIAAMGVILSRMGKALGAEVPTVLALLMDRLRNEITRVATLKALAQISASPSGVDLTPILSDAVQELALLLRQQSRPLKQAALEALLALLASSAAKMDPALLGAVLREAAQLVADSDLHLAHLALQVTGSVLVANPGAATPVIKTDIMPRALTLAASPLLQGLALASLLDLFRALVANNAPGLGFTDLLTALRAAAKSATAATAASSALGGGPLARQTVGNVARCVAATCAAATPSQRSSTVSELVHDMKGGDEARKHLALLVIGELGTQTDLSSAQDLRPLLLSTFEDTNASEEVKAAAAYALGHLAVGSRDTYLPVVLEALETTHHQYLLLSALKEVILCHAHAVPPIDFTAAADQVLPHLFKHCECAEEGVRNMVAECLGVLATLHADKVIPALLQLLERASRTDTAQTAADPLARWTVATALKHCMAGEAPTSALSPHMSTFLKLLHDEDLDTRKAALLLANAAVHHQPNLVADLLATDITPVLLETVELKLERTVDLGPFKHRVDDAEPLRKAALACIDTVLDTMPERLDEVALMPHLARGLGDAKPDVQTLCHQILAKLCELRPGAVLNSLDSLLPPLDKACNKQPKESQVGTEVERALDLIRSALRCVAALSHLEDIEQASRPFVDFKARLLGNPKLATMYEAVTAERKLLEA